MKKRINDEDTIDLLKLFHAIMNKIWLVITVGLLFACGAAGFTKFLVTPTYSSMSTMLVLSKETTLTSLADLQLGSQLTKDYTVLITSRPVLQEVVDNLELDMNYKQLKQCITIDNPSDTRILRLTVTVSDPQLAASIVNELAKSASSYIGDQMEVTPPKIIEEGEVPVYKDGPNMIKNIVIGMMAGMLLVCAIVVVLELMNDSIVNEDDVEMYLGIPTFAVVPDKALEKSGGKSKKKKNKKNKQGRA